MKNNYFFILATFLVLIVENTVAQTGKITGKIVDAQTGETLPGATILVENTKLVAFADIDGKFSIAGVPAGRATLIVNYVSYDNQRIEGVMVRDRDVTNVNVTLRPATGQELVEVEVVTNAIRENNAALVLQQKNNAAVSDGISAETIKRTPDRNAGDVLKRVSGVTVQDDRFVVVRGLNERYNASYLNGCPLPSTEPDRRAFAFHLFPSNMVETIVINKTATPDMPAEFAGGIVQVNTKSIPDKNFVSVSVGTGFNTITTGRDKLGYKGGRLDAWGFDDGSREIPAGVPALSEKRSWISNEAQAEVARSFPNDWSSTRSTFAPNSNAQVSAGYSLRHKGRDLAGLVFSLNNSQTQTRYTFQRAEYDNLEISGDIDRAAVQKEREYISEVYQNQTASGGMLNLTVKPTGNHQLSLKNLFTGAAENRFISALGSNNLVEAEKSINRVTTRYFSANQILSSQLGGRHLLGTSKIKVNWDGGISRITRTVPNLRYMVYSRFENVRESEPNVHDTMFRASIGPTSGPDYAGYRVYSRLDESIYNGNADVSRIFALAESHQVELKTGGLYQQRDRQFNIRQLGLQPYQASDSLYYLPEGQIFELQNLGQGGFKAYELTKDDDNYHAASILRAGYLMGEYRHADKLRITGGARLESYRQFLGVKYPTIDSTFLDGTVNDILPSINLMYQLTKTQSIRGAYCTTLNRPEFRELALANWYDPETRLSVAGNPALLRSYIRNYDFRYEIYPGMGQLFTVTGFYKIFERPIERYLYRNNENLIYYSNANSAKVYGAELEYRIILGGLMGGDSARFLNNLTWFSNLSLIHSEVDVTGIDEVVPDSRPMQGQAPYIINSGLTYADRDAGFAFTAAFNRVGPRIYLVGNNWLPNRWESARNVLDLQVSKTFYHDRLEVRVNVKDALQNDWIVYYKGSARKGNEYQSGTDYVNLRRNYGTTWSMALSYRF